MRHITSFISELRKFNQKEKQKNIIKSKSQKIQEQYEEISRKSIQNPLVEQATIFYGENFDPKERMIGISLVKKKILPQIVPWVKKAIEDIILKENIELDQITDEHNIKKICEYKDTYKNSLIDRAKEVFFNGEYPFPYRDPNYKFSEEEKSRLMESLIKHLVEGERQYIEETCKYAGEQLALLDMLTNKFDEKTNIKRGVKVTYEIEDLLNENDNKNKEIRVIHKKNTGRIYKEEMELYILQAKYEMYLQSKLYPKSSMKVSDIEEELIRAYTKHRLRTVKVDKEYLECIKKENSNRKKRGEKNTLEDVIQSVSRRIEQRNNMGEEFLKKLITKEEATTAKEFIYVAGISHPKSKLTTIEARKRIEGYQDKIQEMDLSDIPAKNNLYAYSDRTSYTKKYSRLEEASIKLEEKEKKKSNELEIDEY